MRPEGEWHSDKPGSAGVPAGELGENCGKAPARRRRSQAEHAYLSAIRLKAATLFRPWLARATRTDADQCARDACTHNAQFLLGAA
jgi:hypothetical protein